MIILLIYRDTFRACQHNGAKHLWDWLDFKFTKQISAPGNLESIMIKRSHLRQCIDEAHTNDQCIGDQDKPK